MAIFLTISRCQFLNRLSHELAQNILNASVVFYCLVNLDSYQKITKIRLQQTTVPIIKSFFYLNEVYYLIVKSKTITLEPRLRPKKNGINGLLKRIMMS